MRMSKQSTVNSARIIFAAAMATYTLAFGYVVWRAMVLQPYADQFGWIARYFQAEADGNWTAYYAPYNFHRMFWTLGGLVLDIRLFGASGLFLILTAVLCLAATVLMISREAVAAAPQGMKLAAAGGAIILTLLASNALDVDQVINTTYVHALVFAVAAIVLATPGEPSAGLTRNRIAALACLAASGFGNAAGLAVWPVLVFSAYRTGADRAWRLTSAIGGGAIVGLYFLGQSPSDAVGPIHHFGSLAHAGLLALYYLGLPWTRAVPSIGWLIGLIVLLAGAVAVAAFGGSRSQRSDRVAVQFVLFTFGTAAMAALGRTGVQVPSATPLRYAVFLIPLHVGLLMLVLPRLARVNADHPKRTAWIAAGIAMIMLAHQAAAGLFVIKTGDIIRTTISQFHAGQRTPRMLEIISPDLAGAEALSLRLQKEGLYQHELVGVPGGER